MILNRKNWFWNFKGLFIEKRQLNLKNNVSFFYQPTLFLTVMLVQMTSLILYPIRDPSFSKTKRNWLHLSENGAHLQEIHWRPSLCHPEILTVRTMRKFQRTFSRARGEVMRSNQLSVVVFLSKTFTRENKAFTWEFLRYHKTFTSLQWKYYQINIISWNRT